MINRKFFTVGYIYIYSIGLVLIDTFTLSRVSSGQIDLGVFSSRVLALFTYWLIVKNIAGMAEKKGYSYKLAMILGIIGLPTIAGGLILLSQ